MSQGPGTTIGNVDVALYIPSRYANGTPIPDATIRHAILMTNELFGVLFGGASGQEPFIGSYRHEDGRIVDERVLRVFSRVMDDKIQDLSLEIRLAQFSRELCGQLDQENIAYEWGPALKYVERTEKKSIKTRRQVAFCKLNSHAQRLLVTISLSRLRSIASLPHLLTLDGWREEVPFSTDPDLPADAKVVARRTGRRAIVLDLALDRSLRQKLGGALNDKDLLFERRPNGKLYVWAKLGADLRGGRQVSHLAENGPLPQSGQQLGLALLGSPLAEKLEYLIDRSAVTNLFYQEYRLLYDRVCRELASSFSPQETMQQGQLLLGRMLFVRFLELKGWLHGETDFLGGKYRTHSSNFYQETLLPLFDRLDSPAGRQDQSRVVPYVNGGLFRRGAAPELPLPDELFDPGDRASLLGILRAYDFTFEEESGQEQLVVDPAMLGNVLEGLCSDEEKKKHGVHYTPTGIALMLAWESILPRLSKITAIVSSRLSQFARESRDTLSPQEATLLRDTLHRLRIVDPSVGSGSLLMACLDVLMKISARCAERLGQPLVRGKHAWAETARRFVRESLFGVDIDPIAVDITKLRLWLAVALWDAEPRPLPNLEFNVQVGDSLSDLSPLSGTVQLEIGFDEATQAKNDFLSILTEYRRAEGADAYRALEKLRAAEDRYRAVLSHVSSGNSSVESESATTPLAFLWRVHFADVFEGLNHGFDIVIANPPYIRAQNLQALGEAVLRDYEKRFRSLRGNKDIYLAFVEQGIKLAGDGGRLAFIMPNFSRTKAATELRNLLAKQGAVDTWVDFGDQQVFETASNFVALLFATAEKSKRQSFQCFRPEEGSWEDHTPYSRGALWLNQSPAGQVPYGPIWRTLSTQEAEFAKSLEVRATPLGKLVTNIGVGVQTSADDVYLMERISSKGKLATLHSKYLDAPVEIECGILKRCAKGSKHLKKYEVIGDSYLLWPYDDLHEPYSEAVLQRRFPHAWEYLTRCRRRLDSRAMSETARSQSPWQYGKDQGVKLGCSPKLIVPSALGTSCAYYDPDGSIATTSSGKGGGGAWGIEVRNGAIDPLWLLAVLNSTPIWTWLQLEGDPKLGGWRGVDLGVLERLPVPRSTSRILDRVRLHVEEIRLALSEGRKAESAMLALDTLVGKAFGFYGQHTSLNTEIT